MCYRFPRGHNSYFNDFIGVFRNATSCDRKKEYSFAKSLYLTALNHLKHAINCPDCSDSQTSICESYIQQINERLNEIESLIQKKAQQPPKNAQNTEDKLPSEIIIENPDIKWDDIAVSNDIKESITKAIIVPLKIPQLFQGNVNPWHGILLYGPQGSGKTYLAKASSSNANKSTILTVSTNSLIYNYNLIQELFDTARSKKPAIILINDIDLLFSQKTVNANEFLNQIDIVNGSKDNIFIIATTNVPWTLDSSVIRRFEKRIFVPLPDFESRKALIKLNINESTSCLNENEIDQISKLTDGYSVADIKSVIKSALLDPVNRLQSAEYFLMYNGTIFPCNPDQPGAVKIKIQDFNAEQLEALGKPVSTFYDFTKACQKVKPLVSLSELTKFEQWTKEFGTEK